MKTGQMITATGIVIGTALATAPTATAATVPIGPNQVFHGLVNGVHDKAQITVVCPGPVKPGATGHPVAGQTIAVAQGPASPAGTGGYTGSAGTSIVAGFSTWSSAGLFRFTAYDDPQSIPTTISLPCSGSDIISFTPQPTSSTAKPDQFTVTFVNIGA